ncbi:concanavalin A-like lectin/glucanase domain-containing protein [Xylaria nigripes]|nr:concanavalin A-like lectin/glucanase domain-containing protein [Xylaria nigripes]
MAPPPGSLLTTGALFLAALSDLVQGRPLTQARANCDCYKASANTSAHFMNRRFFDFRKIANPSTPAPITSQAADAAAGPTHEYFQSEEWTDTWGIQNWETQGEKYLRVNSANNVFIAPDQNGGTYLTMRTQREADYQSTSEVETRTADYQYLSVRMRARTRGSPGAVTALFTYNGATTPEQEADIEIRTDTDSFHVQYTNQPSLTPADEVDQKATRLVKMNRAWDDWLEYRYDWTPGSSDWYINGVKSASIQYHTPTMPLSVIMNVWSDGGIWSGVMDKGNSAEMQVQWLDLTYNSTSQGGSGSCSNVCVIDDLI